MTAGKVKDCGLDFTTKFFAENVQSLRGSSDIIVIETLPSLVRLTSRPCANPAKFSRFDHQH
jgi:hypothetical protein